MLSLILVKTFLPILLNSSSEISEKFPKLHMSNELGCLLLPKIPPNN